MCLLNLSPQNILSIFKVAVKWQHIKFLWKVSFTHTLYSYRQVSSSHGYLGTINRTQVLIIKAPPDTSPHRIGSSVWLVSKICKEESINEIIAIFSIMCLSKTKVSWQPIKAACVEESANRPFKFIEYLSQRHVLCPQYLKQDVMRFWNFQKNIQER